MDKKMVVFVVVGICLVIAIGLAIFFNRLGTLEVVLAPTSELKENITLTLSSEGHKKPHTLPHKQQLSPGRYTVLVWGTGSDTFQEDVQIKSRQTTTVQVVLRRQGSSKSETVPPYYYLFPHYDGDFDIRAEFSEEEHDAKLKKLVITPYIVPMAEDSKEDLRAQKETYVAEARLWLKSRGVPDSIPVDINSFY